MLTCTLVISLTHVSVYAVPGSQLQTAESSAEAAGKTEVMDGLGFDGEDTVCTWEPIDTRERQGEPEGLPETEEGQEGAGADGSSTGETEDQGIDVEDSIKEPSAPKNQNRVTAERIQIEKNVDTAAPTLEDNSEEDNIREHGLDDEEDKPTYTAPEDSRHTNVSFAFSEVASSAYFQELTYPISVGLKEVDTGDRVTLTIRSAGQILEVEKGDYAVVSIKDSGKVPLSVPGDTLHIYGNTEYQVRFVANNALKMFTDFLMDNIFLACFFMCAALLYKKVFIPMFANDVKRR